MDIFIIDINNAENIDDELLQKFRHKNFTNKRKQKEHCLAYLMVDRILKEFYKTENRELEFVSSKPFLKSREKYFSISHSGDYVALGFSDYDCGIDIEKMTERDFSAISKRMGFVSENKEDFYKKWTMFEAEYKLGKKSEMTDSFYYEDYTITAVSGYPKEKFELYIQIGNNFSNL